jgi:uncharacterized membrane protein YkoI
MLRQMHEPMSKFLLEAGFRAGAKARLRTRSKACYQACYQAGSRTGSPIWAAAGLTVAIAVLSILTLPRHGAAAESVHCLTGDELRAATANGKTMPLATVIHTLRRAPKDVIKAQLCQEGDRLIYQLTLLARDGKVKRAVVDASNGAVVGER